MAKRERKNKDVLDTGPVEPILRGERVLDKAAAFPRFINQCECPLDHYYRGGFLVDRQWMAGIRFRELWETAAGNPNVTSSLTRSPSSGNVSERLEIRRADARNEIKALLTGKVDRFGTVTVKPVIPYPFNQILEDVAGLGQWAGKGNIGLLKEALDRLSNYWRIHV